MKFCAEILRSTRRSWISQRGGMTKHIPIKSDCYDVRTWVNIGSWSLNACVIYRLSRIVIAVGYLKEHVHLRLYMYPRCSRTSEWTYTYLVRYRHVWLDMWTIIQKSNPTSRATYRLRPGTLQRTEVTSDTSADWFNNTNISSGVCEEMLMNMYGMYIGRYVENLAKSVGIRCN